MPISFNSCCFSHAGENFSTLTTGDESNREYDRTWIGIKGNIGLIMHKARHVDGFGHTVCCPAGAAGCDQRYDLANLSTYGIRYWLEKSWVDGTLHTGFGCLAPERDHLKNVLRTAANGRRSRFCQDPPPELDDTNNPVPPCDTGCAPQPRFVIDPPVSTLNYSEVEQSFHFTKAVQVRNAGVDELMFTATLSGSGPFALLERNYAVAPGESIQTEVTFRATEPLGGDTATLTLARINDPTVSSDIDFTLLGEIIAARSLDVALVLDRSGSMSELAGERNKSEAQQRAGRLFIRLLRPISRLP